MTRERDMPGQVTGFFSRWFTPIMMALYVLTLALPRVLEDQNFGSWLWLALIVYLTGALMLSYGDRRLRLGVDAGYAIARKG